jgi:hypothetical protein
MTKPPPADVAIRSTEELTAHWADVLHPLVFTARSLWLTWIDHDGMALPVVLPIDDIPLVPDPEMLEGLRRVHVGVGQSHLPLGGHLAMALCRPGGPEVTEDDAAWAEALRGAFDGVPVAPYPSLHLAAGGQVGELEAPPI